MKTQTRSSYRRVPAVTLFAIVGLASSAFADIDPNSGIDFIRVGNTGNAGVPFTDVAPYFQGRGAVSYEYRIGKTEITTAQWVEFYNSVRSAQGDVLETPIFWGAVATGNPNEPFRVASAPGSGMRAVSGIDWRTAAIYCNWLHNNKQNDLPSLLNGAYDATTFGYNGNIFTDQMAHNPDARYWIPTLDEWIKAAYYDPNKNGVGQGGWWRSPNMTDGPMIYGPPPAFGGDGTGQANAGFNLPGNAQFLIPLMSYPQTASAYGMLDAAGGTNEWLETVLTVNDLPYRMSTGSAWTAGGLQIGNDRIDGVGGWFPTDHSSFLGFRIAAAVPSLPAVASFLIPLSIAFSSRSRRSFCHA